MPLTIRDPLRLHSQTVTHSPWKGNTRHVRGIPERAPYVKRCLPIKLPPCHGGRKEQRMDEEESTPEQLLSDAEEILRVANEILNDEEWWQEASQRYLDEQTKFTDRRREV